MYRPYRKQQAEMRSGNRPHLFFGVVAIIWRIVPNTPTGATTMHDLYATYSIVAHDAETGQFGVAVQTHQMSVGRVVPFLLPGMGVVATQSLVNVSFGPLALDFLREGFTAEQIINGLIAADSNPTRRQLAVVDTQGKAAAYTGNGCIPYAGHH